MVMTNILFELNSYYFKAMYLHDLYWNTQFVFKLYLIFDRIHFTFYVGHTQMSKARYYLFFVHIQPVNLSNLSAIKLHWKIILTNYKYANQSIEVQIFDYFLCKIIIITVYESKVLLGKPEIPKYLFSTTNMTKQKK